MHASLQAGATRASLPVDLQAALLAGRLTVAVLQKYLELIAIPIVGALARAFPGRSSHCLTVLRVEAVPCHEYERANDIEAFRWGLTTGHTVQLTRRVANCPLLSVLYGNIIQFAEWIALLPSDSEVKRIFNRQCTVALEL